MNRISAVQVFSLLAIIAGAAVSYFPPPSNAAAIWALVSGFLGYGVRDLFPPTAPVPPAIAAPTNVQSGFASLSMLAVLGAVALGGTLLAGCASAPAGQPLTPQQLAAQVCPAAQITVASLSVLRGLSVEAHEALVVVAPIVDAACAAGALDDIANLRALSERGLPALIKIADDSPLAPDVHDQIVLGLTVGQIVLTGALQATGQSK
jgi:hypothetical protein